MDPPLVPVRMDSIYCTPAVLQWEVRVCELCPTAKGLAGPTDMASRDGRMTCHFFIDESMRREYLLVAGVLAPHELNRTRSLLRGLRLPGERRVHFQAERDPRRAKIVSSLVNAGLRTRVYVGQGRMEEVRRLCLQRLVGDAIKAGAARIVLESRGHALDRKDRNIIAARLSAESDLPEKCSRQRTAVPTRPTYEHLQPHEEPALWIPDAVAWCYGSGSIWRQRVMPMVEAVVDVKKT